MLNPSNLYAEKIFREHPIAMWPLDEQSDYISLITESERTLVGNFVGSPYSTVEADLNATATADETANSPFPESAISKVLPTSTNTILVDNFSIMKYAGVPLTSFNSDMENFAFSFSVKALHSFTTGVDIGYFLSGPTFDLEDFELGKIEALSQPVADEWSMYSSTLPLPKSTAYTHIYPFLSFRFINQTVAGNPIVTDYAYLINGITIGQWSEMFNATSLGVETIQPTTEFNSDGYIVGNQYGLGANDAKYLVADNQILALNTSMPMVYGSGSLTKIIPHPVEGSPSLVIPGFGMLSNYGKYNTYTFESWIRVDGRTSVSRKILGPTDSNNGLYIDREFIRLKIGNGIGSYFVGEWYRPMLIDIKVSPTNASLMINGEEVIAFSHDVDASSFGTNDTWGVYAYSDVPIVEIDCPAIYSYAVSSTIAKRRFAFGQAVESPDGVNKSFGATTAFIDYSVADYTNNYHYPDMGKWNQGMYENVYVDRNTLSSPDHTLPEFVFQSSTYDSWFAEQSVNNLPSFTFGTTPGFIRFDSMSITDQPTAGAYVIFELAEFDSLPQTIFKITNNLTGDSFSASVELDKIIYRLSSQGISQTVDEKIGLVLGSKFFAGISFASVIDAVGNSAESFFSNPSQLTMNVAGDSSFTSIFTGKIYKVGLLTQRNLNKVNDILQTVDDGLPSILDAGYSNTTTWLYTADGGTPEQFGEDTLSSHIATYTLVASNEYDIFTIDVDSDSYWQDYTPLSYFTQYVSNQLGKSYYDLDFIQFNINYPSIPKFKLNAFNTEDALVKTYVSFQTIASGATAQLESFTNIVPAPENGVVNPSASKYSGTWLDSAYEVVDGMIIYPPRDVAFDEIAIVTHIQMQVRNGISNKISIKKLQYASQAFNSDTANPIGTKFDVPVYPYQKYSAYFDYKSRNPYKIYKGSTPYLYLTRKSGIAKVGDYDPLINRGFLVNVNSKAAQQYRVIASQIFMFYEKDKFPAEQIKIFEIQSQYDYIKVYMEPIGTSRKRARIFAIDANTGTDRVAIAFYINGKLTKTPVINVNEWATLGIRFADPIVFDNVPGAIRVTGPILVNNISYYESSSLQEVERRSVRLWDAVTVNGTNWEWWLAQLNRYNETYQWGDVLVIAATKYYGIDPTDIYRSYVGTNKIVSDDNAVFYIGGDGFKVTNKTSWSSYSVKPL